MRTSIRTITLFAALLSACAATPARAQGTAGDSAIYRQAAPLVDSIAVAAKQLCDNKSVPGYYKPTCPQPARVRTILAQLLATSKRDSAVSPPPIVVTPPKDSTPSTPPPPAPSSALVPHPYTAPANGAKLAELPRALVDVTYPAIARRIRVVSLQAALDTARAGDELLLAPGSVHPPVTVKVTGRAGWVVVRSDIVDDGNLSTRMTLARADSLNLATIQSSDATSPVWVNASAQLVRFAVVRMRAGADLNAIWRATNGEQSVAALPRDFILDRVVLDGQSFDVRRCIYADVIRFAVISSTLENCHSRNGDAQGFEAANAPGPFLIRNNTIHGSHQGTMFGGVDSHSIDMMPADAVIEDNLIERPPEWTAAGWGEKTLAEQKALLRGLYQRNIVRHVHANGQAGFGFLVKTENQSCTAPWTQSADITIRWNLIDDAANGFNFAANVGACAGVNAARITAYGNTFGPFNGTDAGTCVQLLGALSDVVVLHNTCANAGGAVVTLDGSTLAQRTVLSGNVFPHGQYGVKGASTTEGTASITKFLPGALFESNVVYPAQCSLYPAGTLCALPATLPLAPDGKAIGADPATLP